MKTLQMIPVATLSLTLLSGLAGLAAHAGPAVEETTVREEGAPLTYQMPAAQDHRRVQRSIPVSFADLNLNRSAGLNTLYRRLERATEQACGPREDGRNLALHRDQRQCQSRAMDSAVAEIGHFALDDLHLARTGRSIDRGEALAER
ncbi:MAG: hypothetical protein CME40_01060 [Haliea sp.]|nr:hypothetical protein [Haliea sp.]|tara:strand:- start:115569 stop:116009 length:441 start_codon:yes stop_codon:yes gene_type:complete